MAINRMHEGLPTSLMLSSSEVMKKVFKGSASVGTVGQSVICAAEVFKVMMIAIGEQLGTVTSVKHIYAVGSDPMIRKTLVSNAVGNMDMVFGKPSVDGKALDARNGILKEIPYCDILVASVSDTAKVSPTLGMAGIRDSSDYETVILTTKKAQPAFILIELGRKRCPENDRDRAVAVVREELGELGYAVHTSERCSTKFGSVVEDQVRTWCVAARGPSLSAPSPSSHVPVEQFDPQMQKAWNSLQIKPLLANDFLRKIHGAEPQPPHHLGDVDFTEMHNELYTEKNIPWPPKPMDQLLKSVVGNTAASSMMSKLTRRMQEIVFFVENTQDMPPLSDEALIDLSMPLKSIAKRVSPEGLSIANSIPAVHASSFIWMRQTCDFMKQNELALLCGLPNVDRAMELIGTDGLPDTTSGYLIASALLAASSCFAEEISEGTGTDVS